MHDVDDLLANLDFLIDRKSPACKALLESYQKASDMASVLPHGIDDRALVSLSKKEGTAFVKGYSQALQTAALSFVKQFVKFMGKCYLKLKTDMKDIDRLMKSKGKKSKTHKHHKDECKKSLEDVKKHLSQFRAMPNFPIFWFLLTDAHIKIQSLGVELGKSPVCTHLEAFLGILVITRSNSHSVRPDSNWSRLLTLTQEDWDQALEESRSSAD